MKKVLFTVTQITILLTVFLNIVVNAQTPGFMSRYWDGCKPHCSWANKAGEDNLCKECDKNNKEIDPPEQFGDASSCDGGGSYTCWDMIPFVDPDDKNLAYAFAATPGTDEDCGSCYELTFDGGHHEDADSYATNKALVGKKLIVMASNIGHDVSSDENQFDLLVPGGGLGNYDSFSEQLGYASFDVLGTRSGGLVSDCIDTMVRQFGWWEPGSPDGGKNVKTVTVEFQECLKNRCNTVFNKPEHDLLNRGCNFYADWFMAADNPTMTYRKLDRCPDILSKKYRVGSGGSGIPTVKDTLKFVEAESLTAPALNPCAAGQEIQPMCIGTSGDITHIYADGGDSAVYTVTVPEGRAGEYSLRLRAANAWAPVTITVTVNGANAGEVVVDYTTSWTKYTTVTLRPEIPLNEGENTIKLRFSNRISVDYFLLIGTLQGQSPVKFNSAKTNKTRSNVVLRPINRGFTAMLPKGHSYSSYSLINLQGREIRSGAVKTGAAELNFNNINKGVLFLRLKGKNSTAVLKTTTF